jgi:flagellar biosynthetic protein FliQ
MTVDSVIDLAREAMMMTLTLAAPPLIVGLLIGLVVAVLQAVTQVHDPSISLVPRMMAILLTIVVCLPWLIERMVAYSQTVFTHVSMLSGTG